MTPSLFGYFYAIAVFTLALFFAVVALSIFFAREAAKVWRDINLMILEVDDKKWGDK